MIGLLIRLYFAIAVNNACTIGVATDYYAWVDAHPSYRVAWSLESPIFGDYWLMQDGGETMLFKFKEPINQTISTGASHGACFRKVQ